MIVAKAESSQTIKFISRSQNFSGSVNITDKQTNTATNILVGSFGTDRHYTTVTLDLSSLTNERKYLFIARCSDQGEMFRGILFLTAMEVDDYTINDGVYSEPDAVNEYLVA